ncbi:MAG: DUF3795 domain-containing protein [Bacillota bacterium]|nr:DUF3795 domain-containing protein [Bacillota bacterium]
MLTKCGANCNECRVFGSECSGCEENCGKPCWNELIGGEKCPIYKCCENNQFNNCGMCGSLPCKIWYELKDPSMSDAEHIESVNRRVGILKNK